MRPTVTVTEVVEGPAVEAFYATGTLQPVDEYPIKAHSAGLLQKLEGDKPFPKKGDHVTAGQSLAIVADAQWQAALDKCKAELDEKRQRADEKTSPGPDRAGRQDLRDAGPVHHRQARRKPDRPPARDRRFLAERVRPGAEPRPGDDDGP